MFWGGPTSWQLCLDMLHEGRKEREMFYNKERKGLENLQVVDRVGGINTKKKKMKVLNSQIKSLEVDTLR